MLGGRQPTGTTPEVFSPVLRAATGCSRYTYNIGGLKAQMLLGEGYRSLTSQHARALPCRGGYEEMRGDYIPCVPSHLDAFLYLSCSLLEFCAWGAHIALIVTESDGKGFWRR